MRYSSFIISLFLQQTFIEYLCSCAWDKKTVLVLKELTLMEVTKGPRVVTKYKSLLFYLMSCCLVFSVANVFRTIFIVFLATLRTISPT